VINKIDTMNEQELKMYVLKLISKYNALVDSHNDMVDNYDHSYYIAREKKEFMLPHI